MKTFLIGAILICLIALIFFKSISILFKILVNAGLGAVILFTYNIIAVSFGLNIDITPIRSFFVGFFGTPAVIVMILLKIL